MLKDFKDTIIAPVTGVQPSAVAILRISGSQAIDISKKVFSHWPSEFKYRYAYYGTFKNSDDGLLIAFENNKSFTGEECVEWQIHGSLASIQSLIDLSCREGARFAKPGEFTMRAYFNGKIDLTRAEAIKDSIDAKTESHFRLASNVRNGKIYLECLDIKKSILKILAQVEASTDFSEEVGDLNTLEVSEVLTLLLKKLDLLLNSKSSSKLLRKGVRIALVGKPNAGKSSILNMCLGRARAIVTDIPGTTRDTIEESIEIAGFPCILVDTAGLRTARDIVEQIGIDKSKDELENADIVWYVYDASLGWSTEDQEVYGNITCPKIKIANKSDLIRLIPEGIKISTFTSQGHQDLMLATKKLVPGIDIENQIYLNERQTDLLEKIHNLMINSLHTIQNNYSSDLLSVDLYTVIRYISEILGESANPDVIQEIFSEFCLGK